jgi:hypothetical protein
MFRSKNARRRRAIDPFLHPATCPDCAAVFQDGRWQWLPVPERTCYRLCPACIRVREEAPGGCLRIEGELLSRHRNEVVELARALAEQARDADPLARIMAISDLPDAVAITATDGQLMQQIGDVLRRVYPGLSKIQVSPGIDPRPFGR